MLQSLPREVECTPFWPQRMTTNTTDPRENARSLAKLKLEAEATKKALSIGTNASFSVESLAEGIDFASTINRLRYETIARKVFEGFNRLIEGVVKKAGLDVLDIDEVILSGGTSHTPKIASNMRSIFPDSTTILAPSTLPTAINPSELQARGAALQFSQSQATPLKVFSLQSLQPRQPFLPDAPSTLPRLKREAMCS